MSSRTTIPLLISLALIGLGGSTQAFAGPAARTPVCPSVEVLARQWAEAIAAGALLVQPGANACLSAKRYPDIHLPSVPPSEPPASESLPDSIVLPNEGFQVENVRKGELGTEVIRLSWKDAASGKRVEDELTLLLNRGGAARDLGCAGLYEGFKKHRVRLQGCR